MKRLLVATIAVLFTSQAVLAYWNTTDVTRSVASKQRLPLRIKVVPVADDKTPTTYEITYEVILTGPFAYLRSAKLVAFDGKTLLFSVPVANPIHFANPEDEPERDGPETVTGKFLVGKELLGKCRLNLECPAGGPWSTNGQTVSVDIGSYFK